MIYACCSILTLFSLGCDVGYGLLHRIPVKAAPAAMESRKEQDLLYMRSSSMDGTSDHRDKPLLSVSSPVETTDTSLSTAEAAYLLPIAPGNTSMPPASFSLNGEQNDPFDTEDSQQAAVSLGHRHSNADASETIAAV